MSLHFTPGTAVTVVYAGAATPVIAHAVLVSAEGDDIALDLGHDAAIPDGARIILDLPPESGASRAIADVGSRSGLRLHARLVRVPSPEHREYPRLAGLVHLGWRAAAGAADAEAWLRGEPAGGEEHRPDPFMNFSATGLAFDDGPGATEDALILLELSIPGEPGAWRGTARVVRVSPIPVDERDEEATTTHRVAVSFESLAPEATAALTRYTLRMQDLMLGEEP